MFYIPLWCLTSIINKLINMLNFLAIIFLINGIVQNECANILAAFPVPSISHQIVFRSLMLELVKRGHKVTVITPDPAFPKEKCPQNLTEIDVHDLSYTMWNKVMNIKKDKESEGRSILNVIYHTFQAIFEEQLKTSEVQELLHNKKRTFDLLFIESSARPTIGLSYRYKVPVIEICSLGPIYETLDMIGAVTNPLLYPNSLRHRISDMTLWEKVSEIYTQYKAESEYSKLEAVENKMLKRIFGAQIPDIKELKKNVQMLFLNTYAIWDFNRPVPPSVLYLGGLHEQPSKPLSQDIKSYLDSSINGVIYVSFGTNVKPSLLPPEKIQIFTKVFSQLPYNVLWKWDKDKIAGQPQNVNVSKWYPQSDLLKHPNVKLFITQGGLQSTDEAITAGVPLIGIPMLADQWFNVEMYRIHNIGVKLSIETITEDILKNTIESVIENTNYRQNIIKLRNTMRDQPHTSLERAVWWTEHVLRHGNAAHLRTPAAYMHWTEYYALDLVLLFISILLFILIAAVFFIHLTVNSFKIKYARIKTKTI